jgi:hypothetical protein
VRFVETKYSNGISTTIYRSLGHVIGGGELEIDPTKMEVILMWPTPTNVIAVRRFV